MKLKNQLIIALGNSGLANTTEHDVPAADAYKAYKFRKAVIKAYQELAEKEKDFPKDAGVEEGKKPSEEQNKRISALRAEMLKDESEIGDIKKMSFESYHILSKENKAVPVQFQLGDKVVNRNIDVFRAFEEELEGVLWEAPKEEE
ncbi:MAG: hypothetical protein IKH15_07685 [Bacteroidales bacterium]|nr:hypothetical protein [Bacteroidales bacterium]